MGRFVSGLIGTGVSELPRDYFDIICSVSVVEHVPEPNVKAFAKEVHDLLRPEGVAYHSFDVNWRRPVRYFYDAHIEAGLEPIESEDQFFVPWERWIKSSSNADAMARVRDVLFEDPTIVYEHFMRYQPEPIRAAPPNFCTILAGYRRPGSTIAADAAPVSS